MQLSVDQWSPTPKIWLTKVYPTKSACLKPLQHHSLGCWQMPNVVWWVWPSVLNKRPILTHSKCCGITPTVRSTSAGLTDSVHPSRSKVVQTRHARCTLRSKPEANDINCQLTAADQGWLKSKTRGGDCMHTLPLLDWEPGSYMVPNSSNKKFLFQKKKWKCISHMKTPMFLMSTCKN